MLRAHSDTLGVVLITIIAYLENNITAVVVAALASNPHMGTKEITKEAGVVV